MEEQDEIYKNDLKQKTNEWEKLLRELEASYQRMLKE